jgi:prepilin-type N-terminal cleavage/methylation domain-containing protein
MPMPVDPMQSLARRGARDERGVSLIELVIVLAIIGVISAITAPNVIQWQRNQRVKGAARDVADLLLLARAEAARTGDRHIVVYGPGGTTEPGGAAIGAPFVVFDDGPPAGSNCQLDAGEAQELVRAVDDVMWGVSLATVRAPDDPGAAPFAPPQVSGGTTADPANNAVAWLMFRPDGVPVPFQGPGGGACGTIGATASGGAAFYLTNGERDYAVVLSRMGGVRVHAWDPTVGAWST